MKLLERNSAGLRVSVTWDREPDGTETLLLICSAAGSGVVVEIPPDRVLDAFEHPSCYVPLDALLQHTQTAE